MENIIEAKIEKPDGTIIIIKGSPDQVAKATTIFSEQPRLLDFSAHPTATAFSGVAEIGPDGKLHIVAKDLKAKGFLDAARRLIYIFLLARRELLSEEKTSRALLIQLLRVWGLYDGNVRRFIPQDRSLIKEGRKMIYLATVAMNTAWQFVRDVQDESKKSTWRPGTRNRQRRRNHNNKVENNENPEISESSVSEPEVVQNSQ